MQQEASTLSDRILNDQRMNKSNINWIKRTCCKAVLRVSIECHEKGLFRYAKQIDKVMKTFNLDPKKILLQRHIHTELYIRYVFM